MNKRLKLLVVAFLVLLAGCTGGAGNADAGGSEVSLSTDASGAPESQDASLEGDDDLPQVQKRAVIRNGRLELTVDEFNTSRDEIESTAESYGGYVSDSSERVNRRSGGTYRSGQLVVRVPSDNFSAFMTDAKQLGEVEHVETNSEDVTEQLVDLEARLSNLRAQRDRLRELYDSANTTQDVLAVEKRLTDVQTEIERLEAQKQSLEDRVALSTVRVSLSERPPGPAQWYDVPVLQAFLASVNGVFVALRALVVAFAYALPYIVVFGGLLAVLGGGMYAVGRAAFRRLST
ncbi:DUF4349 domain-containing protein [Haloferax mediterranei ATCC 33500]|uniref:DUF4349 domain-containing protein n=1 Tax=Haloferax mediterranei (strain ATCC 33500 / DSM 1411 / JCM 8866 / NBRC 14739 / NCIMB 2177 / R-4) TaxID=523841 RepID=I3R564_HALMT|nr:DUF4349 domain-containing protein [Haloferax mediterranei]AFK19374.1 hypothetical protein HFX_1668 [Haloferax mediterranei ATCC 33500]AHZ21275.1 hypothetical protein BM92_00770 [Haloferax mediterranei ATCC 33500]EMA04436.1 hypothetical protein C439_02137 [Haloferax mediterranei ATCC 33500]MDX5989477.1 DUF4349 domain-containing protein [Haloferax mediterranei ATCC 33500]QCQ75838.1 DUF4349 domain-containing protein [Haloferax mediterranei ATCC 33500]